MVMCIIAAIFVICLVAVIIVLTSLSVEPKLVETEIRYDSIRESSIVTGVVHTGFKEYKEIIVELVPTRIEINGIMHLPNPKWNIIFPSTMKLEHFALATSYQPEEFEVKIYWREFY